MPDGAVFGGFKPGAVGREGVVEELVIDGGDLGVVGLGEVAGLPSGERECLFVEFDFLGGEAGAIFVEVGLNESGLGFAGGEFGITEPKGFEFDGGEGFGLPFGLRPGLELGSGFGNLQAFPLDGFPFAGDFLIGQLLFEGLLAFLISDLFPFQFLKPLLDGRGVLFGLVAGDHRHREGGEEGRGENAFHSDERLDHKTQE